jgi:phosphatidylglycerophosphatase C
MARSVVVFDLDGTLTKRDISVPFLGFIAGGWSTLLGLVSAGAWAIPDLNRALAAERRASRGRLGSARGRWEGLLHERVVAQTLRGRSRSELETAAERFAHARLRNALRADARDRLDGHLRRGHRLVLASASLAICLEPLREILGFDTVLGTRLEFRDGLATGRFDGLPCWGDEKLLRVQEVLGPGEKIIHAYGDSRGDRALLRAARNSTLVR